MENSLVATVDADMAGYLALPPREQITSLIADLLAEFGANCNLPIKHSFAPGLYMREMFIPAGTLLVGKIHRVECMNICTIGDIEIFTERGRIRVSAGFTAPSAAGIQKIGYAYEDTIWVNVFRTDETDIAKLEAALVYSDSEAIALLDPEGKYFKAKELECLQAGFKPASRSTARIKGRKAARAVPPAPPTR